MEATTEVMEATEARRRIDRIRAGLDDIRDEVLALWRGQGWLALGYPTWAEMCNAELPFRLALPRDERPQLVAELKSEGMSGPAIAGALGIDEKTVRNDLATSDNSEVKPTIGLDGREYAPRIPRDLPKAPAPELTEEDQRAIERHQADVRRWTRTAEAVVTLWSISGPWMEGFDDANLNDPIFTDTWTPDFLAHARDNLEQLIEWSKNR